MAGASIAGDALFEHGFYYADAKRRYLKQVELYYKNKKVPMVSAYTREIVDKIKSLIKEQSHLKAAGYPSEHPKYRVTSRYELIEQNGEEVLICKRLMTDDPIVQVVPAEECFDILVDVHLKTNHGTRDKMLREIKKSRYVVPKTSVDFLLVVCNGCKISGRSQATNEKMEPVFNSRGQVSIIDMTTRPDNEFKYVLCYLDKFTGFLFLRPLMTNSIQETAMELLKIFLDFGPPEKIESYNRPYFNKVMSLINTAHNEFNISCAVPIKMPDITPNDVRNMLEKWQKNTRSTNWAIGCHMVQWKNNIAMKSKNNQQSPYSLVFQGSYALKYSKQCNSQENEKTQAEDSSIDVLSTIDVNSKSPTPLEMNDNSSNSQRLLEGDDTEILIVHEDSEEDDDCLITITEAPDESAPKIISVSSNLASKGPNILTKTTSKEVSIEKSIASDKPTNLKTIDASSNTKPNDQTGEVLKEKQQGISNDLPEPTNKKCHVCKTTIMKAYICTKCHRNVHLYCSDRLLQPNISPDVLTVNCTSCRLRNTRFEKMKRKFDEMDGDSDKTNTTIKH